MLASLRRTSQTETRSQVHPWGPWGDSYSSSTGVSVTSSSAVQLLTVYGAASLISDTIATLPTDVFRTVNGGPEGVAKPPWLNQPNPRTNFVEFVSQTLWSLLIDGNAYWAYGVDGNFLPTDLYALDPCEVQVRPADRGNDVEYWVRGERFTGRLLHIKGICRPGDVKGLSPVEAARQSIGLGLAAQEFASRFYSNGASLSGYISTDADLTQDQASQLQSSWASAHSGLANAHRPGVLDNGATWNASTVTPDQAQFLETRNFQAAEIAGQMFLLDPTMLGIPVQTNSLTYANLEQRGIHLVQFTLLRWIVRLEKAFTFLLPRPHYFKFNVGGLERADLKTRYEAHRIALGPNVPFKTVNESRALEELSPIPGGDALPEPPAPVSPAPPSEPQANMIHVHVPEQPAPIVDVHVQPAPLEVHNHQDPAVVDVIVNPAPVEVNLPEMQITNDVHVDPTPIRVDVAPAEVTVNPGEINVESPVVNMQPQFNVEAPNVNIRQQPIRIDAPQVNMPKQGKIRRTFERDENDVIIAIIEEPVEDEESQG